MSPRVATLAEVGTLVLVLSAGAVALTGGVLAASLRLRSTVSFLLATYLLASAEIVAASLVLSTGRWLERDALVVVIGATLAVALACWIRLGRPVPPLPASGAASVRALVRDPVVATLGALAVVTHVYVLAVALTVPQGIGDALLYHLPRAALWKQQHSVAYVNDAPDERVNTFPPNAEIESMASMILSGGDRYVSLVQLLSLAFVCVAIFGIARRLGFDRRQAAFAALLFSTFTVVVLQAPTALNDLVVASLLSVCAYFALGTPRRELTLAALALGLALGTKLTAVFALPALALFVFAAQPRRTWMRLALFGAAGAVAGSYWLGVNLAETGRLDGGVTLDEGADPIAERLWLHLRDLLELSDEEGKGFLVSPTWSFGGFVVALVAAAAFVVLGRRRAGARAMLVGAAVFVAVPMLVIWARVAEHVLDRARGSASGARVPEGLYESAMHSSYGLAFVVGLLAAGVLVVCAVRLGTVSVAAIMALASVPLTLIVLSIALAYDPQHMRYLAFPAVLATATFGVVLDRRILAWTSVALTAGTLVVTLGYFSPRPAGLALLRENRDSDRTARWLVQAESGRGDPEAFRFLEEAIPTGATLALAVVRDTYLYPVWDAGLRRTVLFVDENGAVPEEAEWLVVGPGKSLDTESWRLALATEGGWRILRR